MTPGGPLNPRPAGDGGKWVLFYVFAAIFVYAVLTVGLAVALALA